MSHKNFVIIDPQVIEMMCVRYRDGTTIKDLMIEFGHGRNKIVRTLKEALGAEYVECGKRIRLKASSRAGKSNLGRKNPHTPEWNAKIAAAHIGLGHTDETKALLSQRNKERELDPEWQARKPEIIRKIVESKRASGYFELHARRHSEWMRAHAPMRGKKMSDETRALMSVRKHELIATGWQPVQKEWTVERREQVRQHTKQMWRNGAFSYGEDGIKRSKLEKRVYAAILERYPDARHTFPIHTPERSYYYDVCVPSLNTIIEVNGDFWHCNPAVLSEQEWKLVRDVEAVRARDADKLHVATEAGFRVVVLWENQLLADFERTVFEQLLLKSM